MELWFGAQERIVKTWTWPWLGGLSSCAVLRLRN